MRYVVQGTVVLRERNGEIVRQIPTFYVEAYSEKDARAIATDVLTALAGDGELNLTVERSFAYGS